MTSFFSPHQPAFGPGEIDVRWYEQHGKYVAWFGEGSDRVSLHLLPADAAEFVAKLTAAMIARGDDKMRADAAEAEERQWATIVGVRDEPSVDGIEDHATDRSRDERMGAS